MEDTHFKRLQGQLGDIFYQLRRVQFTHISHRKIWSPAINAYMCTEAVAICVDLAGVEKTLLDLRVEPRRLLIRGRREPPEPAGAEHKPVQILAMEIDHGGFEREIQLPSDVETERVTAEQKNGLLWIYLPVRCHA